MSEKKLTREADTSTLYEFKGSVPKPSLLVPLSLQHVLAAVVGVITPSNDDDSGSVAPYCHCNITTVIPDF